MQMLSYLEAYKIIKREIEAIPKEIEQELLLNSEARFLAEDIVSQGIFVDFG